jgi:crotonobetainyl-CoA:carnitine CoA-transferase CaiB-like acyl-CoA transferase
VRARRPDVVYCSISGFGAREPLDRPGYDFIVQAESGLMAITGDPGGEPTKIGVALVDVLTGLNASTAILAALHRRERTGEGERIEVSLLDSAFAALVNVAASALVTGEEPPRYGNAHPSIVPYQPFRAADGWVAVAAANEGLFGRLCNAIGRPDLAADERYATNDARVRNREPLVAELEDAFAARPADVWVDLLLGAGVPAGKIRGVGEALRSAQATTRVEHPTAGPLELVDPPFSLTGASVAQPTAPPLLGEHTAEVLAELGVDEGRLAALERRGATRLGT